MIQNHALVEMTAEKTREKHSGDPNSCVQILRGYQCDYIPSEKPKSTEVDQVETMQKFVLNITENVKQLKLSKKLML